MEGWQIKVFSWIRERTVVREVAQVTVILPLVGQQPSQSSGGFGNNGSIAINRSANGAGGGAGQAGHSGTGLETDSSGAGGDGGNGFVVNIDGNDYYYGGGGGGAGTELPS